MKVHIVGDVLVKGTGIGGSTYGNACIVYKGDNVEDIVNEGDILIVKKLEEEQYRILDKINGVITEEAGLMSETAVMCINMGIPVIVGAEGAVDTIRTGTLVTMDTRNGTVYSGKTNIM
jgi:pyruvate kinase